VLDIEIIDSKWGSNIYANNLDFRTFDSRDFFFIVPLSSVFDIYKRIKVFEMLEIRSNISK